MEYDPIKMQLAKSLGKHAVLRRCFHVMLEWLFLRAWYVKRELRSVLKVLQSENKSGVVKAIDVGMGFGQFTEQIIKICPISKVVGMEVERSYFYNGESYFKGKYPQQVSFTIGDGTRLPFVDACADLVLTVDVMEHIDKDQDAFNEFYRILKPKGFYIMHTPRVQEDGDVQEGELFDPALCQVGEHVRNGYKNSVAKERFEKAGFKVLRIINGYGVLGMVAWNMLQKFPIWMLGISWILAPFVVVYLVAISPIAFILMGSDYLIKHHKRGGSILVVAQKLDVR